MLGLRVGRIIKIKIEVPGDETLMRSGSCKRQKSVELTEKE